MKFSLLFMLLATAFSQKFDDKSIKNTELFKVLESASRSQQTIFIETFTGLT
jgi:hypothetical protein